MKKEDFKNRVKICFGKNDVRCVAGKELDGEIAYRTGKAIVEFLKCREFVVGHDMRTSSHKLRDAFIEGVIDYGADVIDIGAIDSPGLYFASGFLNKPGGMITASHNPAKYNGIKLVRSGARPVGEKTGLEKIREMVAENKFREIKRRGNVRKKDLFPAYKKHVQSFINTKNISGIKIVIDAGNGMAGRMVPIGYKDLNVKITPLDFRLDGRFPTHEANPANPDNIRDLRKKVISQKADFGIAFDGDMDRVFFVDEAGKIVDSSTIAALLIKHFYNKKDKTNVVYNTVMSKIVPETVQKLGGKAFKEKVGHSYIKIRMRKVRAVFGAEHSAHYYYRDNYYADSGLITSLIVCEIFAKSKQSGTKFSELLKGFEKYHKITEKSFKVKDKAETIRKLEREYYRNAKRSEKRDGLTLDFGDWWFNVRMSNTEPLVRLNLEAEEESVMKEMTIKISKAIKPST